MKHPELTPDENAILLDFIWDCFENKSWNKSWMELYCYVMRDAYIWKASDETVNDVFIKEMKSEDLSSRWQC